MKFLSQLILKCWYCLVQIIFTLIILNNFSFKNEWFEWLSSSQLKLPGLEKHDMHDHTVIKATTWPWPLMMMSMTAMFFKSYRMIAIISHDSWCGDCMNTVATYLGVVMIWGLGNWIFWVLSGSARRGLDWNAVPISNNVATSEKVLGYCELPDRECNAYRMLLSDFLISFSDYLIGLFSILWKVSSACSFDNLLNSVSNLFELE